MPKFDAGTAVEKLEYDFSHYKGPVGVTPQPSDHAFKKFSAKQSKIMIDADRIEKEMAEAEKSGTLSEEKLDEFQRRGDELSEKMSKTVAELCQDQPSKDDVDKLPYRVKMAYMKHLMSQFAPEGETSGTSN